MHATEVAVPSEEAAAAAGALAAAEAALAKPNDSSHRVTWSETARAQEKVNFMSYLGMHVFNPDWNQDGVKVKDRDVQSAVTFHSSTFTECKLTIFGSQESITLPVQTCTKVMDVKNALAAQAMVSAEAIQFVVKRGCSYAIQKDHDEVGRRVTVKGLESFEPLPHKYPHPTVFIGAGYNGIKHMVYWSHYGVKDFVAYDRYDRVGGHAWLVQANKTSKLQTELAAFHVWFGTEFGEGNEKLSYPVDWSTWPKQDECIAHMQHAAEAYGIIPHIKFNHNVSSMDIVGKPNELDRHYLLSVTNKTTNEVSSVPFSSVYHFPGAYFNPRIIDYPGEDEFDGHIGYGMNNDIPFDYLKDSKTAILGNGAFAIENIRTCVEYGVEKVYLITRRKNLPCPRIVCWFAHQAIVPVPAAMMLNMMIPFFQQTGFGDPWSYHSVYGNREKGNCTIKSASRFGIGDVTFLAVAAGRCEYHQDLLKRCSRHCLHLEKGTKLDGVTNVIKCLGLIADWEADRFHKIKEMIGAWPSGDYRRVIFADPLGMDAANFTTLSAGIGGYYSSISAKHLIEFPMEHRRLQDMGVIDMLPRNKATEHRPAHQYDARYAQTTGMMVDGSMPRCAMKAMGVDDYMHKCYMAVNPPDRFYKECVDGWNQYQEDWKKQGYGTEYIPYPYSWEDVEGFFDDYRRTVGPTSIAEKLAGWQPSAKVVHQPDDHEMEAKERLGDLALPLPAGPPAQAPPEAGADHGQGGQARGGQVYMDNYGSKRWWLENCRGPAGGMNHH